MSKIKTFMVVMLMISSGSVFAAGVSTKFYLNNKSSQSVVVNNITVDAGAENVKVAEIKDSAKLMQNRYFSHNLTILTTEGNALCKLQEHVTTHYHWFDIPFFKTGPKIDHAIAWVMEPNCEVNLNHRARAGFGGDDISVNIDVYSHN